MSLIRSLLDTHICYPLFLQQLFNVDLCTILILHLIKVVPLSTIGKRQGQDLHQACLPPKPRFKVLHQAAEVSMVIVLEICWLNDSIRTGC